ncbi:MAG: malate synthase A [Actinomycetota bacterium]|nr:malate synthase A [Actinomycetota bacterium]
MSSAPQVPHVDGVEVRAEWRDGYEQVLTEESLGLLARLQREFGPRRAELLQRRAQRDAELAAGALPDFLPETAEVRGGDWTVASPAPGLVDRRVEITGPTDRKMVINALNCGAKVFMADFEDSNTPTFDNLVQGQVNLRNAWLRQIDFTSPEGKSYALNDTVATLVVRNRGWHLPERHVLVDGEPVSGSLFDFCMYMTTSAKIALDKGFGPYFYLPKMESHLEARLWNDVFLAGQEALGIPRGTIRATCLIETILGAFEMEEILYELREHSSGLNAGRWDYIFSMIKKFRTRGEEFLLPDRSEVKMTVPFMRAYTELLVKSCHSHGAHAIGGMAAFIPNRRDAAVNDAALSAVRADKSREADDGFDGSWVAHPDLVPTALEVFDAKLGDKPNQLDRRRDDVQVTAQQLLAAKETPGRVTEVGVRNNVSVGIQYIEAWLRGNGAVAIFNLMEDAATAEISRSQVWQWIHNGARTAEGSAITGDYVRQLETEELEKVKAAVGEQAYASGRYDEARKLFEQVALADDFVEFLTLPAYERLG